MTHQKRPTGVTVLAIVEIVLGIFSFIGGFLHIFLGIGGLVGFSGQDVFLGQIANALGSSLVLFGILFIALGIGSWTGKKWALTVGVVIAVLGLITGVISLALGTVGSVPGIALNLVVIYCLSRPTVKNFFQSRPKEPSMNDMARP